MQKPRSTNSLETPRFCGIPTFMRLPHTRDLDGVDAAIIGLPFDTGSPYRVGCRFGPREIRNISVLLRPINPYHDIDVFEHLSVIDYGDARIVPGDTLRSFEVMEEDLRPVVSAGIKPLCFGGDNSVSLSQIRELGRHHGKISLIHLDAHTDTWDDYLGLKHMSGSAYRRGVEEGWIDSATSIQVGMRGSLFSREDIQQSVKLGYKLIHTDEMLEIGMVETARRIKERVGDNKVFISIDMDVVDPAYAPGVQIPECGGPTAHNILTLLRNLGGVNVVGAEVMELNHLYDSGEITALLAATFGAELLALMALNKRG
jgi:agmatinase